MAAFTWQSWLMNVQYSSRCIHTYPIWLLFLLRRRSHFVHFSWRPFAQQFKKIIYLSFSYSIYFSTHFLLGVDVKTIRSWRRSTACCETTPPLTPAVPSWGPPPRPNTHSRRPRRTACHWRRPSPTGRCGGRWWALPACTSILWPPYCPTLTLFSRTTSSDLGSVD